MTASWQSWILRVLSKAPFAVTMISAMNYGNDSFAQPILPLDPTENVASYISCFDAHKVTLVSAHRGGPIPGYPENALETLQYAVSYGPVLLEVDVRETADGHLVLMHDETLERTTTGEGKLADFTLAELQDFRLVDNQGNETKFSIPTLDSVLKWADEKAILQLDIKRGIDIRKVAQAVVEANATDSVLLIAYRTQDAVRALTIDESLSFNISINNIEKLSSLENAGISKEQIVAWTGIARKPQTLPVWRDLEELDVPASAGALWDLERQIIASNNPQPYIDMGRAGVDIIASDYYQLAFDTLNQHQDLSGTISACKGQ